MERQVRGLQVGMPSAAHGTTTGQPEGQELLCGAPGRSGFCSPQELWQFRGRCKGAHQQVLGPQDSQGSELKTPAEVMTCSCSVVPAA